MQELEAVRLEIAKVNGQMSRIVAEMISEKVTRKESNDRIYKKLDALDIILRGENGLSMRVKQLEIVNMDEKKRNYNNFNRWTGIISLVLAVAAIIMANHK